MPPHIADMLALLHVLLVYGRHLATTLEHRSTAWGFSVIAQYFGTASVPVILARISRGLLRVQALQRVLLDRARRGRDLVWLGRREPAPRKPQSPQAPAEQPQAESQRRPPRPPRQRDTDAAPDPANLPTIAQLEAEIRRHPLGRAVADICQDFGVYPDLCGVRFWNALFDTIIWYRGNLARYIKQLRRRVAAFEPELNFTPSLQLPEKTREGICRMLGFFIGEQWPVMPYPVPSPRAAWATHPP